MESLPFILLTEAYGILFLPLSAWAYYLAHTKDILTTELLLISLAGGIILMSVPVCYQLIKNKVLKHSDTVQAAETQISFLKRPV